MSEPGEVLAAGGAVYRWGLSSGGGLEVLLVHRPMYDDWTLPKGKLQEGEDAASAALREVAEETGLVCELGPSLPTTSYVDMKGRPKTVRYWAMVPAEGAVLKPDGVEVDEAEWLGLAAAADRLSYLRDREVLAALTSVLGSAGGQ